MIKAKEGGMRKRVEKVHFFNFIKIHNAVRVFVVLHVFVDDFSKLVFVCFVKNYIISPSTTSHTKTHTPTSTPQNSIHLKPSENQLPHSTLY